MFIIIGENQKAIEFLISEELLDFITDDKEQYIRNAFTHGLKSPLVLKKYFYFKIIENFFTSIN